MHTDPLHLQLQATSHCVLDCAGCPEHCQSSKPRHFFAQEYFSGLDTAILHLHIETLVVTGGEPFLHQDLTGFCTDLCARYSRPLTVVTNGFWLSHKDITYFDPLFRTISGLDVTLHEPVLNRMGGFENARAFLALLHERHPHLAVAVRTADPLPMSTCTDTAHEVSTYCRQADSPRLLPDGRLARCPVVATHDQLLHLLPGVVPADRHFYDLNTFDPHSFWFWYKRYPLDACPFCAFSLPEAARETAPTQPALVTCHDQSYHVATAVRLFHSGLIGPAVEKLFDTLKAYPDFQGAYTDLALIFQELGYRQKAAQLLDQARHLDPDHCPETQTPSA